MKNDKKPQVRFKGFNDDWEQRKVGEFLTESRESGHKGDVAHKMTVKLWGKGVYEKNETGSANTQYFTRHAGQFIYSKLDFLNCAFGVVPEELDSLETTADVPAFDCDGVNPYFMFYTAIQPIFYEKNGMIADGSRKAKRIHANTFLEMPFFVPSLTEQNKIVNLLSELDHLITLHQRKCDKLQKIKKSMLEKMFPQNGMKKPEIRFKGFNDDWEQRKLGEMGSTFTGLSGKTKEDFGHGDAKFITYMNVFSNPIANLDMTEYVEIDSKQNCVKAGDVFFTTSSETPEEVGMSCVMSENADNIYLNSFCFGYRPTVEFDLNYLAYVLRAESFRKNMTFLAQGISRYNISKNKVMEIKISVPSLDEQNLVGAYFSDLDHLITLHQSKHYKVIFIKELYLGNSVRLVNF